jgi:hypothetical protein
MTILASEIIGDARATLIDDDADTYSAEQMLGFVSDAQGLVCNYKPDAYTKHEFVPMAASTDQEIPADGTQFLMATQNEVSKRSATMVDQSMLDTENRFWRAATGETDVQHWCADPRDPRRFDITPPNNGTGSLRVLYCAVPPVLEEPEDPIALVDTYKYALYAFTLHRAYAETSRKGDVQKADYWLKNGLQAIGIKSSATVALAPKLEKSGEG